MIILNLGANLGDRHKALMTARERLNAQVRVIKSSVIYETGPRNVLDQPKFLNASLAVETDKSPQELLALCHMIEQDMGRQPNERYGPRHIDIDIIYYKQQILDTPKLIIPHPRRVERRFVLRPVSDIASDFVDPLTHSTVAEMLQELVDVDDVVPFTQQW